MNNALAADALSSHSQTTEFQCEKRRSDRDRSECTVEVAGIKKYAEQRKRSRSSRPRINRLRNHCYSAHPVVPMKDICPWCVGQLCNNLKAQCD